MRGVTLACAVLVASLSASACGGASSSPKQSLGNASTTSTQPTGADAQLRTASLAWAHAYLTGTALDQFGLQGPECLSEGPPKLTPANLRAAATALQQERVRIERFAGVSVATIQSKIIGVSVRNVTADTGEAEVNYDLPVSATGNDNWVTYELKNGKWKVQDCHAPFGGSSSSSSVTVTP